MASVGTSSLPIDDALAKLPVIVWRQEISFPVGNLHTTFSQDIAQHKKPDRDGAKLEATGRAPIIVSCNALFYNGLVFDASANTSQPLFPDVFKAFLLACADRTTDTLLHPFLGAMQCKVQSFESSIDAARRDGATVHVTWIEHQDDSFVLGTPSPLAFATIAAGQLDSALTSFPTIPKPKTSFASLMFQIQGAADRISLLQKQGAAIIPGAIYQVQQTQNALASLATVSTHTANALCESLKAGLFATQKALNVRTKVTNYVVPTDQTLAQISTTLLTPVSVLVNLNPALLSATIVKRGSIVRYQKTTTGG